jgi:hypothetical protein
MVVRVKVKVRIRGEDAEKRLRRWGCMFTILRGSVPGHRGLRMGG